MFEAEEGTIMIDSQGHPVDQTLLDRVTILDRGVETLSTENGEKFDMYIIGFEVTENGVVFRCVLASDFGDVASREAYDSVIRFGQYEVLQRAGLLP